MSSNPGRNYYRLALVLRKAVFLSLWKGSLTKKMLSGGKRFEGSEMDYS